MQGMSKSVYVLYCMVWYCRNFCFGRNLFSCFTFFTGPLVLRTGTVPARPPGFLTALGPPFPQHPDWSALSSNQPTSPARIFRCQDSAPCRCPPALRLASRKQASTPEAAPRGRPDNRSKLKTEWPVFASPVSSIRHEFVVADSFRRLVDSNHWRNTGSELARTLYWSETRDERENIGW